MQKVWNSRIICHAKSPGQVTRVDVLFIILAKVILGKTLFAGLETSSAR